MAETVFILGAGASKQGGAPLMANFLDEARRLWRRGEVGPASQDFDRVFKTLAQLQAVHSKSEMDITNVESVFAALEMAKTLSRLVPGTSEDQIHAAISSLKWVIAKTLEWTLQFPTRDKDVLPPPPYDQFANLVDHLRQRAHPRHSVAVLTFNYDVAVDLALLAKDMSPDYGFEGSLSATQAVPVLKLHGSLNWGTCSECNEIVTCDLRPALKRSHSLPLNPGSKIHLDISSKLSSFRHRCGMALAPEPMLVPPTWNKGEYHATLSKVWARAAKELSEAENLFVCGYSLPESDAFFRFLYGLGTVGDQPLTRFWVCDPDSSGSVRARFESILGPGARRRFEYKMVTFDDAIRVIENEFLERS